MNALLRLLVLSLLAVSCRSAGGDPGTTPGSGYETRAPSRDGIGKLYFGREIAAVMGFAAAQWLERPERLTEERPDLVLEGLALRPRDVVADLGAGTGYFALRIAALVPEGKVYAIDVQPEMIDVVAKRAGEAGIANLETRLATATDPRLEPSSVDVVLMVDVYHELSHPREVLAAVAAALRPKGRLVLIEFRGEDPSVPIKPLHKMTEAQARREVEAAGLVWRETKAMLPMQHFLVFAKPE